MHVVGAAAAQQHHARAGFLVFVFLHLVGDAGDAANRSVTRRLRRFSRRLGGELARKRETGGCHRQALQETTTGKRE